MADKADEPTFPIVDKKSGLAIDKTLGDVPKYRVYFWARRPDADQHVEGDQDHWHPESEHATLEDANKRAAELKAGGKKKSILGPSAGTTKH